MRTASKFGAILLNFHLIPAYVALFRDLFLNRYFVCFCSLISAIFYLKKYVLYGNSTMRTASKFGANLPNFHQIPAYVALFREKSLNRYFPPPATKV